MKRAWADAARVEEVRHAARGWAHAKAIDPPTLSAIETAYPETRITLHPVWRVLIFLLGCVALGALFGGVFYTLRSIESGRWATAVSAAVLLGVTEALRGSRISGTGADAATSFVGLSFALATVVLFLTVESGPSWTTLLAFATVFGALAAWRWGFWFYALAGAACGFVLVGRMPYARLTWIVLSLLLMALIYPRFDRASIVPPHRRSLAAVFVVSAAALYIAVNLFALDHSFVEWIRFEQFRAEQFAGRPAGLPAAASLRIAAALATAAFPVAFLLWGIRTRRRLLLGIGLASAILSAATFRYDFPIGPRWAWLTACGVVLVGAAMWAHRRLRDAAGGAWRGLTAAPLYSIDTEGISPLGALGAHVAVPTAPEPERPGFTGGGGGFGGGGATGQY